METTDLMRLAEQIEREDNYLVDYLLGWCGLGPEQPWGAAHSFALEIGAGYGLIKGESDPTPTERGKAVAAALRAKEQGPIVAKIGDLEASTECPVCGWSEPHNHEPDKRRGYHTRLDEQTRLADHYRAAFAHLKSELRTLLSLTPKQFQHIKTLPTDETRKYLQDKRK